MRRVKYFKRHRMELDLRHGLPAAELPAGYYWLPWEYALLDVHARVKLNCFEGEPDAAVFPCLGTLAGCRDLMAAIVTRPGFCPAATWLLASADGAIATVQGLLDANRYGGIQNVGVVPECRGLGLGKAILLKALAGFVSVGVPRAFLEVTADNHHAMRIYRLLGFRSYKTLYREVELAPAAAGLVGVGL